MQQLSAIDAGFIYAEAPHQPQHIGTLTICDPSTAPDGIVRFKDIIQHTKDTAYLFPHTYRRLVEVPFNADFPYWINEAELDAEFHLRHIALPKPGDWRQLCIQVARLHSRPLDRNRPLWELYVIEGLDNVEGVPPGSFAFLSKVHHACIDGAGGTEMSMEAVNWTPGDSGSPAWKADPVPSPESLLARANFNAFTKPAEYAKFLYDSAGTMQDYAGKLWRGEIKPQPTAPWTRFNGTVSPHRVFDGVIFDFARIRGLKQEIGGTVNDVVLAICSGAMRRYLMQCDELPEESLVTECPINVRDSSSAKGGVVVLNMPVALRTEVANVRTRALAICQESRESKERFQAVGAKTMMESSHFLTPGLEILGARAATEQAIRNVGNPVFNCVTTNVPGVQEPVYSLGAKVLRNFGTGNIMDGCGLFHTINSYNGEIIISFTSCRDMMPDPANYADCLREAYNELEAEFLPKKPARRARKSTAAKAGAKKKPALKRKAAKKPATARKAAAAKPKAAKPKAAKKAAVASKPAAAKRKTAKKPATAKRKPKS